MFSRLLPGLVTTYLDHTYCCFSITLTCLFLITGFVYTVFARPFPVRAARFSDTSRTPSTARPADTRRRFRTTTAEYSVCIVSTLASMT
jgi:hypothetical protein